MIKKQKQKIYFLANISQEELFLNGHHIKEGQEYELMYLFESFIRQIKKGKFLELGCGTGLLSRYIYLFFKDIIPYGVDINHKFIVRAKKNNSKIKNNFKTADFFTLPSVFFKKYQTVAIFMGIRENEEDDWVKLEKLVKNILRDNEEVLLVISDYDSNLLEIKSSTIKKFVSEMKKMSNIDFVDNNFFLVGKEVRVTSKIKYKERRFLKELLDGSIVQKGKDYFFLQRKKGSRKKKFFLTPETIFFEKDLKPPDYFVNSVRVISQREVRVGDCVSVSIEVKKNNAITITKMVKIKNE